VYAVGDVTPGPQFTHASWDDHRILFDILDGHPRRTRADRLVPHAVFTDPQVAGVGLSERVAKERGIAYDVATMPFSWVARAVESDETAGVLKVLVEKGGERLLGAMIVGAEAAELIHIFVANMVSGASARTLVDAEMVHPAFAEGVQSVLMKLPQLAT
jgi:pyruvate/2-oxoglutarate dehydrogenase complex dihydrolipoamide dehydrogenase (E3) component